MWVWGGVVEGKKNHSGLPSKEDGGQREVKKCPSRATQRNIEKKKKMVLSTRKEIKKKRGEGGKSHLGRTLEELDRMLRR